jgi:Omp85 superfamily domain
MTRIHLERIMTLVIALSIGSAAAAQSSQDEASRAKTLSTARDQKAESVTPPARSMTERVLYWYDNRGESSLSWNGFHMNLGNFSGGAGLAAGIGFTRHAIGSSIVDPYQANRIDLDLSAGRSILGYQRLSARVDVLNVASAPINIALMWRDDQMPQEDFYGLGQDSSESHRVSYRLDTTDVTAAIEWKPFERIVIGGAVAHLSPVLGRGTDSRFPSIEAAYDPSTAPGLGGLPEFIRADARLGFDWRDNASHPRRGGHYQVTASRFDGQGDDRTDFRRVDIHLQQIVPLGNRYRRLELRAQAALTGADSDARIPVIYMPYVGGSSTLRGFATSRFQDHQAVSMTAEYQWEAWWALDAAVFVDAGQVQRTVGDFSVRSFATNYGIGLRIHSNSKFLARLDLAYGREGFRPLLGFKYGF